MSPFQCGLAMNTFPGYMIHSPLSTLSCIETLSDNSLHGPAICNLGSILFWQVLSQFQSLLSYGNGVILHVKTRHLSAFHNYTRVFLFYKGDVVLWLFMDWLESTLTNTHYNEKTLDPEFQQNIRIDSKVARAESESECYRPYPRRIILRSRHQLPDGKLQNEGRALCSAAGLLCTMAKGEEYSEYTETILAHYRVDKPFKCFYQL